MHRRSFVLLRAFEECGYVSVRGEGGTLNCSVLKREDNLEFTWQNGEVIKRARREKRKR